MVGRRGVSRRTARRTSRRVGRRQAAMRDAVTRAEHETAAPAEAVPEAPAPSDQDARYAKLKEAKELLDAGILTQEEFEAEKAKILEN